MKTIFRPDNADRLAAALLPGERVLLRALAQVALVDRELSAISILVAFELAARRLGSQIPAVIEITPLGRTVVAQLEASPARELQP